ncbi:MAG: hydrogenase formation protein HypD [Candidatus Marinimicrobia bacterium]|nr:hydrogenase formation protein HypD [Candidatus Neomarinimicrobiota bacterium]MBL7023306.1 hydrogenase formation protein HypD [Candidatus Neomarinimicrobiota bacterium]
MKYLNEFRNPEIAKKYLDKIHKITTKEWNIMEICGGQTHSIMKYGIQEMLPKKVNLVHGPGCPVCVTPLEQLDKAISIASRSDVIFTSFGDMLRVPGSEKDLLSVKAEGGDVRVVYSPLGAVQIAQENPDKEIVFFAVGFETTAPGNAMAVHQAKKRGLKNFSVLVSHVLVPPAVEVILSSPINKVQGFLAAGHVCTVMGYQEYIPIAEKYKVPFIVTGFEPIDIIEGIYQCVKQLEEGKSEVVNQYSRSVSAKGNNNAQNIVTEVFDTKPRKWRGIGEIPGSGFGLTKQYSDFDAETKFGVEEYKAEEPAECIAGLVLQGVNKPNECPAFGKSCTPEHPLGATMVSTEGACSAYYRYRNIKTS